MKNTSATLRVARLEARGRRYQTLRANTDRWFYDYRTEEFFAGPKLPTPHSHPLGQPGPAGAVPSNWQALLHK